MIKGYRGCRYGFLTILTLLILIPIIACACGGGAASTTGTGPATTSAHTTAVGTTTRTTTAAQNTGGLTSIEASNLAWPKAKEAFKDAVLWRMAPVKDRAGTVIMLDANWTSNDRASAWFIWYADPIGEDWLLISIQGKSIANVDIGTRGFSPIPMDSKWPRQATAVAMKDAAATAAKQGAHLDAVTWVEYSLDYALSDVRRNPVWVFACSEDLANGGSLNYRMFVDAMTGAVVGCYNERDEKLALPINRTALTQTHATSHEADVRQFFSLISSGDVQMAVFQMAYQAAPNDAAKAAWQANFKSLKTLKVISIEQVQLESWTSEWERYKVTLEITTGEPPDKYGWENGRNTRWVTIIPQGGGAWKVAELAFSP